MSAESGHLGEELLRRAARGEELESEWQAHLADCTSCREEVDLLRALHGAVTVGQRSGPCPDDLLLARFAQGDLSSSEENEIGLHVSVCRTCGPLHESLREATESAGGLPVLPLPGPIVRLTERLAALVQFEMPMSLAMQARSATAGAASLVFAKAMESYREGRHDDALQGLEEAIGAGEDSAAASYFFGACLLRAGRHAEASEAFRTAVGRAGKRGDYRLLFAQALLLEGKGEEAQAELQRATRVPGAHRKAARELLGELEEVLGND
ncbi:MAG: tetratricopeptide repeat protein [Acidobacteriota bacterium]